MDAKHGTNVRSALEVLIEVVLTGPASAPGPDVCADLDRLSTALHRAYELRWNADLFEDADAALAVVERFAATAGFAPIPHCEGCSMKAPFWADELARDLQRSLAA